MKADNVKKLFAVSFKERLEELDFKRVGNFYRATLENNLSLEVKLQIDKWGWNRYTGSRMTVVIEPVYAGWGLVGSPHFKQIRIGEIVSKNKKSTQVIADIMNNFVEKINYIDIAHDLYSSLSGKWTKRRVQSSTSTWMHYYDQEDVLAWFSGVADEIVDIVAETKNEASVLSKNDLNAYKEQTQNIFLK